MSKIKIDHLVNVRVGEKFENMHPIIAIKIKKFKNIGQM